MGNAIGASKPGPQAAFIHQRSKTRFTILNRDGQLRHQIERGGISADLAVAYRIGSGNHATGYLVRLGQWLFESLAENYKRLDLWDVAPGYEAMTHPDFNRRVGQDCLSCHSSGTIDPCSPSLANSATDPRGSIGKAQLAPTSIILRA